MMTSTIARTSFNATSNNVHPTEVSMTSAVSLESAIQENPAFKAAFDMGDNRKKQKSEKEHPPIIIQSSKDPAASGNGHNCDCLLSGPRGLVSAVTHAYNAHHNLILRPDDIWQAILTQFSFYVNGRSEALRDKFVDFQGKKTLVVEAVGTLFTVDFGGLANRMVDEQIIKNIKDPQVAAWLLPDFTTTTPNDRIAASVSIMSTLKAYFEYVFELGCGIPQVTLEGSVEDWKKLRSKLDRLLDYDLPDDDRQGKQKNNGFMTKWYALLVPVIDEMVASVEDKPTLDFWDKICHHHGGGSGPRYLSGWITVFACFTKDGGWQGNVPFRAPHHQFGFSGDGREYVDTGKPSPFSYPFINTNYLPVGALSVPVLVNDNGIQYDTQMLAGQFAYEAVEGDNNGGKLDTLRPRTDWCIAYEGKPKENPRDYIAGECRNT